MYILLASSFSFHILRSPFTLFFFFFNATATTEIYTLSLHDALPIFGKTLRASPLLVEECLVFARFGVDRRAKTRHSSTDRKSTRLNSSHLGISYAVFCLKKKKKKKNNKTKTKESNRLHNTEKKTNIE